MADDGYIRRGAVKNPRRKSARPRSHLQEKRLTSSAGAVFICMARMLHPQHCGTREGAPKEAAAGSGSFRERHLAGKRGARAHAAPRSDPVSCEQTLHEAALGVWYRDASGKGSAGGLLLAHLGFRCLLPLLRTAH